MSGAGETWKTLKRPRFHVLNLSGIVYRNTSKITTQCYSQGINQQKCVGKFWYLKYFSCGVRLRNTSRLFLATQTLDAEIWTTNQNTQKAWHTFVYWYFVNDCVHSFCSCCGIWYPINSLERTSVVSTLTASSHLLKEKSLKLYFYRKLHLLSFLLIYSLMGFYWNQRTYELFPEGHPRRWDVTLIRFILSTSLKTFLSKHFSRKIWGRPFHKMIWTLQKKLFLTRVTLSVPCWHRHALQYQ